MRCILFERRIRFYVFHKITDLLSKIYNLKLRNEIQTNGSVELTTFSFLTSQLIQRITVCSPPFDVKFDMLGRSCEIHIVRANVQNNVNILKLSHTLKIGY